MGKDENEPDGLEFTDLLGNITAHDNKVSVNWKVNTKDTLGTADTFYNAREDLDSDTGDSEVNSNSGTEDLEVDGPGPVVKDPEVEEVNDHIPEEVGEVLEEEVGNNVKETMYNPKGN